MTSLVSLMCHRQGHIDCGVRIGRHCSVLPCLLISREVDCCGSCPEDSTAGCVQAYGPDYKVVGVKSREVLLNAGNIHCITQQWVAGW